ncbi:BtrH N-terminal domain-containing protein [Clostridium sp.]|uniref:BtrH N-terminal domain-containing protein n=1 Tax=Clostridium sp. TaxID=1506 RepID=UPI003F40FB5D
MLDIKNIFNDSKIYNCYTGALATVCKYNNIDFRLMFQDSWNFRYDFDNYIDVIGGNLNCNNNYWHNLQKYCNVTINSHKYINKEESIKIFNNYILENQPVIIHYDTFWCPWLPDYQTIHAYHTSVVYDIEKENISCLDLIPYNKQANIPIDILGKGIYSYEIIDKKDIIFNVSYEEFIKEQYNKATENEYEYFENMIRYGELIKSELDINKEKETNKIELMYKVKFLNDLRSIAVCKGSYLLSIEYILENNYKNNLNEFKKVMRSISNEWINLWTVSFKYFLSNKYNLNLKQYIGEKIIELILFERECIEKLVETDKNNTSQIAEDKFCSKNNIYDKNKYIKLNIKDHFNNKAISLDLENINKADYTLHGHYFIDINNNDIYKFEGLDIRRPRFNGYDNDNISCMSQKICVENIIIKKFVILGGCEYGDCTTSFKIIFEDNTIETMQVGFSDWVNNPKFGEEVAFSYPCSRDGKGKEINGEAKLFVSKFIIRNLNKKVKYIELPILPNMHIFDIYSSN